MIHPSTRKIGRYKQHLLTNPTPSESRISYLLSALAIRFIPQKAFIKGATYIVDFYIPSMKLAIEVDGGYHLKPSQIEYDKRKTNYLTKARNFRLLRISNEKADTITEQDLSSIIAGLAVTSRGTFTEIK